MAVIEQIAHYNTWRTRHEALYPGKPFASVMLPGDENGMHFGLFDDNKLITVISVFITGDELQFRKFATLPAYQGKGYGTLMLSHVMAFARDEKLKRIWCNARTAATAFYNRFGLHEAGTPFVKNDIEYVIMERYL
ncbi:MAG TPA: GNAT family N-acetyltransferase [Sphingobacteriaceae bacterium]